jgi:fumarate reductase iron-sulfur subunit
MGGSGQGSIEVSIWRGGAAGGDFARYEVPRQTNQTVLDVVTWVQRHEAPDLSYRFACRVGVCGSCAMTVNGKPRWTCRTRIDRIDHEGPLTVAPLRNLPVVKDLACDLAPFFEKWERAMGRYVPAEGVGDVPEMAVVEPGSKQRRAVDASIECIGCGVCYAACDTVAWNPDYLGPAALNRAWTLQNDVRDGGHDERLRAVSGEGGCQACHTHTSCAELCPKNLNPTRSIAGLKRQAMFAAFKGKL